MKKGKLILKDGTSFDGYIFGAEKPALEKLFFSTGMVGYPQSLTDPSFHGQILTFTVPLVGNYGIPPQTKKEHDFNDFFESERVHVKGIIVNEYSENFSHWHATQSLSDFLKEWDIPGITGIDTRALTKHLREKGSQPGKIVVDNKDVAYFDPNAQNIIPEVSPKKVKIYKPTNSSQGNAKKNCGRCGLWSEK